MKHKKILSVQDISCFGQCSLTVALPILSACGVETAILPSAILSTHTAGFEGYTFRDLTEDMPSIKDHWKQEGIKFDAIYTGYLGSKRQIDIVKEIANDLLTENGLLIVDPVMADNGQLYPGFDMDFVEDMKKLAFSADIILPNITEATLLTGLPYKETYDEEYIDSILRALHSLGAKTVVLTGVGYSKDTTGVVVSVEGNKDYYCHRKIKTGWHGTGDVFASAFTGSYVSGKSLYEAATVAADFAVDCIDNTLGHDDHWYGVKFEPLLGKLSPKGEE